MMAVLLDQNRPLDATFRKGCCGNCEAFDPMGAGTNSPYRKFRAKAGYCLWTQIKSKMMTVYVNNVPCGKFVMVAIGK
jgi:hypothetical protein